MALVRRMKRIGAGMHHRSIAADDSNPLLRNLIDIVVTSHAFGKDQDIDDLGVHPVHDAGASCAKSPAVSQLTCELLPDFVSSPFCVRSEMTFRMALASVYFCGLQANPFFL